jgi:NTP pyrophosphatase (non-canonical NTP hydrolase)
MQPKIEEDFMASFDMLQEEVYQCNIDHGFWTPPASTEDGTKLALIHAEVSEALEAIRDGDPPDKHLPELNSVVVELADVVIRVMDFAQRHNYDLSTAIIRKAKYNLSRPHKHGGKKF